MMIDTELLGQDPAKPLDAERFRRVVAGGDEMDRIVLRGAVGALSGLARDEGVAAGVQRVLHEVGARAGYEADAADGLFAAADDERLAPAYCRSDAFDERRKRFGLGQRSL